LLAARFPDPPPVDVLSLSQGSCALRLLSDCRRAGVARADTAAQPLAQAYPAAARSALFGTRKGVALAMLANLEWGGYCGRAAEALVTRYGLSERAVGFFRFFAGPPPGFTEQAASVVAAGLAAGEDPREAVRAALALHAYEIAFWDALADGLG
jgi:hypothetical protein